jgi:MFS family permease
VTPLALVALAAVLPRLLALPLAGVLTDRWNRRFVLVLADSGQAVGTVVLLASLALEQFQLWQLYVVTLVQAGFATFHEPAFYALTTHLIPAHARVRANALAQLAGPASGIVAPALAGWLYTVIGVVGVIGLDLMTFVVAVGGIVLVRIPQPVQSSGANSAHTPFWHAVKEGVSYLRQRRDLGVLFLLLGVVNGIFLGTYLLHLPYLLLRVGDPALVGSLLGIMHTGALCGGLALGVWGGLRSRIHTMLGALLLSGMCLILVGMSRSPLLLGMTLFGIMFCPPFVHAPLMALIQDSVPSAFQGRMFALLGLLSQALTPLAYLGVGPLVDSILEPAVGRPGWRVVAPLVGDAAGAGMGLLMLIGGSVVVLVTLACYGRIAVWGVEVEQRECKGPSDGS